MTKYWLITLILSILASGITKAMKNTKANQKLHKTSSNSNKEIIETIKTLWGKEKKDLLIKLKNSLNENLVLRNTLILAIPATVFLTLAIERFVWYYRKKTRAIDQPAREACLEKRRN